MGRFDIRDETERLDPERLRRAEARARAHSSPSIAGALGVEERR